MIKALMNTLLVGIGLLAGMLISAVSGISPDMESGNQITGMAYAVAGVPERPSPGDHIPESDIIVYGDRVILDIQGAQWSTFTDTNSMDPIIDQGANAIQKVPKSVDEIGVGDIISYESEFADGIIIHRVVEKGQDENGVYFVAKGDNLPTNDPGKIRFNQIKRVVVAIVY
jgi:hypothetical protein